MYIWSQGVWLVVAGERGCLLLVSVPHCKSYDVRAVGGWGKEAQLSWTPSGPIPILSALPEGWRSIQPLPPKKSRALQLSQDLSAWGSSLHKGLLVNLHANHRQELRPLGRYTLIGLAPNYT